MPDHFDVAVAGAGPAGSTTALLFARRGYRVALVDQAHFPRTKACAEYMSPGVGEVLARLELRGIVQNAHPLTVKGMDIVSPRAGVLRLEYGPGADAPRALTLPRRELDAVLVGAAAGAGVEVFEGTRVRGLVFESGRAAGLEIAGGRSGGTFGARLVVIADGARSALARSVGVARAPRWPVRLGLVAHFRGSRPWPEEFGQMHVARDGYCGVAPLPDAEEEGRPGRLNVALVVSPKVFGQVRLSASEFFDWWVDGHPLLREALVGFEREGKVRGVSPIGARCARASVDGALIAGDAAGFFDPFTGEGIYRALRSAELAADVGDRALQDGNLSARSLSVYDRERRRAFAQKTAVTALIQGFVRNPALLEYASTRLRHRTAPLQALTTVLGDIADAGTFLNPQMIWLSLRP